MPDNSTVLHKLGEVINEVDGSVTSLVTWYDNYHTYFWVAGIFLAPFNSFSLVTFCVALGKFNSVKINLPYSSISNAVGKFIPFQFDNHYHILFVVFVHYLNIS